MTLNGKTRLSVMRVINEVHRLLEELTTGLLVEQEMLTSRNTYRRRQLGPCFLFVVFLFFLQTIDRDFGLAKKSWPIR